MLGVLDKLVEVGDDDSRTGRRVGRERLGKRGEFAGRVQRACDRGCQDGIHLDTRRDDLVLSLQVGRQSRYHAADFGDFPFGEAVPLQRIETGGEQIGRGAENVGLGPSLGLALGSGELGAVRGNLSRGLGDDPAFGDCRHGLVDDGRLGSIDVAQDDPADNSGCDRESRDAGEGSEQAARDAEAAEHRQIRTLVGIERQSASECRS